MISIHADAVRNRSVKGSSVYTLSERGATPDKVAAALAAKENAADAVGGVMPDQVEDPLVIRILGDMAKRDSLNSSQLLAENILGKLHRTGPIKYNDPKRARFVVLGALEIPSVLVELDYISNPGRERLLKNSKHQKQLASALFNASVNFFQRMGRLKQVQARTHTVKRGESLWSIAQHYGISISRLRSVNGLDSTGLRIGQRLRLPQS
jgi:N-acetylmuramoyl-L-alanine amidase